MTGVHIIMRIGLHSHFGKYCCSALPEAKHKQYVHMRPSSTMNENANTHTTHARADAHALS